MRCFTSRLALAAALTCLLFGCGGANTVATATNKVVQPTLLALDLVEAKELPKTTVNNAVVYVTRTDVMLLFQQPTAVGRGGYDPGLIAIEVTDTVTGLAALDTQCSTAGGHPPYNTAIFFSPGLFKVDLKKNDPAGTSAETLGSCFLLVTQPAK